MDVGRRLVIDPSNLETDRYLGSGSQVVPAVIEDVNSLTQIIRVRALSIWAWQIVPNSSLVIQ